MSQQHLQRIITNNLQIPNVFDTGWVANSDWTDQLLGNTAGANLVHNLSANLRDLDVRVFIASDGTDGNSFEILTHNYYGVSAGDEHGITVFQIDTNTLQIQTAALGVVYASPVSGQTILLDTEAFYYRVIVRIARPIYSWVPSLIKFETGWINTSDWTSQLLGNTAGAALVHNLNTNISDLFITVLVSPNSNGSEACLIADSEQNASGFVRGYNITEVDKNTIRVLTDADGVRYMDTSGSATVIDTESYYYNVIVRKLL